MSIDDDHAKRVIQSQPFVMIPKWVLMNPALSAGAIRCYGLLVDFANTEHRAWPSRDVLAERAFASAKSVTRWLQELTGEGAIVIARRFNQTSLYYLPATREEAELHVLSSQENNGDKITQVKKSPDVMGTKLPDVGDKFTPRKGQKRPSNKNQLTRTNEQDSIRAEAEILPVVAENNPAKRSRAPDEIWDALIAVFAIEPDQITKSHRGMLNSVVAELRAVGATGQDVYNRSAAYRLKHPQWEFTPPSLVKHWASLFGTSRLTQPLSQRSATLASWAIDNNQEEHP